MTAWNFGVCLFILSFRYLQQLLFCLFVFFFCFAIMVFSCFLIIHSFVCFSQWLHKLMVWIKCIQISLSLCFITAPSLSPEERRSLLFGSGDRSDQSERNHRAQHWIKGWTTDRMAGCGGCVEVMTLSIDPSLHNFHGLLGPFSQPAGVH